MDDHIIFSFFLDYFDQFLKLQELDNRICKAGKKLVVDIVEGNPRLNEDQKKALKNVSIAGSISEGATLARLFSANKVFPDGCNREAEVDIEFVVTEVPLEHKVLVTDIIEKPGYLRLQTDTALLTLANNIGWNISEEDKADIISKVCSTEGYVQPYKIKEYALSKVKYKDEKGATKIIIAAALGKKKKDVSFEADQSITKSSVGSDFLLRIDGQPFLNISFDTVPLFRIPWWPSIAEEWKRRERKWPSDEVIDEITSVCYIIAKPSVEEKYNNETTELRYAFAHVERELVLMRSPHQNLVYLIFKVLIYKWIKPIDSDHLSSFLAKSIMLWTCESHPPDHQLWHQSSTLDVLSYLLQQLLEAFQKGELPYFFINHINVIEAVPENIRRAVCDKISQMLSNLTMCLPTSMDAELKAAHEILHMINETCDILREIKRKDYSRLLRQPELIGDVLSYFIRDMDLKDLLKKGEEELKRVERKVREEAKRSETKVREEVKRSEQKIRSETKRVEKKLRKKFKL